MRVVQLLPAMRRAGAESVVATLCGGLSGAGHEVHLVIVGAEFEYRDELKGRNIHVHSLKIVGRNLRFYDLLGRIRIDRGLSKCLSALKPDIVHAHLSDALIWAAPTLHRLKVPTVYSQHGMDRSLKDSDLVAKWRRWQFSSAVQATKCRLLAVSESVKHYMVHHLKLTDSAVTVVPNPINSARFFPQRSDRTRPQEVLMIGTLYHLKRVSVGIKAMEYLNDFPHAELKVVGDGQDRKTLEAQAAQSAKNTRINFLGVRSDTERLLCATGMLWQLSEREGLPMAVLEAMACGVPVIATNVYGNNDLIVDGENGLLVQLDDAPAVAVATRTLWNTPTLRKRIIRGGLRTAARHGIDAIVPILEGLYEDARKKYAG